MQWTIPLVMALLGCGGGDDIADDIAAPLGEPLPSATADQLVVFERGKTVVKKHFTRAEGQGPGFNVDACASCHEKPVVGGSAGLYRNFFLHFRTLDDGTLMPGISAGNQSGIVREYDSEPGAPVHPSVSPLDDVMSQRNPIPLFGTGLLGEIPAREILKREDPDDKDHDGISGHANYDTNGRLGRFGRKCQAPDLEEFIRAPFNNHLGITTDPLTDAQRARLPVPRPTPVTLLEQAKDLLFGARAWAQVPVDDVPLVDSDDAPDPELSGDDLADVISFVELLAAPQFDAMGPAEEHGQKLFGRIGCDGCHVPRLDGPRGPIPAYTDLLVHDMGHDLADGVSMNDATGSEFRTQPLWGVVAVAPYLHDGRAPTLDAAIRLHGGEGSGARDRFVALDPSDQQDVLAFLESLGGRSQRSEGLLAPDAPIPDPGALGGPTTALGGADLADFAAGRALFDRDFSPAEGLGFPRFDGDSCRACHIQPTIGGAGLRGVDVVRHAIINDHGDYVVPAVGTMLHRETTALHVVNQPQEGTAIFELRNTPPLYGVGLIDAIPDAVVLANADPDDANGDGISGKASWTDDHRLGKFGWKADVPSLAEFVRDAVTNELGMTLPRVDGLTFGRIDDNDDIADPELTLDDANALGAFLGRLAPPPRVPAADPAAAARGEGVFHSVGCDACHVPTLDSPNGPVALYSDLLLHDILPPGTRGIESASATMTEFRTAPLWGIAVTAPYLHDGSAETFADAIAGHDGEAVATRARFDALSDADKASLFAFLGTL